MFFHNRSMDIYMFFDLASSFSASHAENLYAATLPLKLEIRQLLKNELFLAVAIDKLLIKKMIVVNCLIC